MNARSAPGIYCTPNIQKAVHLFFSFPFFPFLSSFLSSLSSSLLSLPFFFLFLSSFSSFLLSLHFFFLFLSSFSSSLLPFSSIFPFSPILLPFTLRLLPAAAASRAARGLRGRVELSFCRLCRRWVGGRMSNAKDTAVHADHRVDAEGRLAGLSIIARAAARWGRCRCEVADRRWAISLAAQEGV